MVAEKKIVALCFQLNKDSAITYETVIDVLMSLTNCSVSDFVKLFDFLLQQTKVKCLDTDNHEGNMLELVKAILRRLLMLTIAFAQQTSGMLATSLVDVIMLSAGTVRRKDA